MAKGARLSRKDLEVPLLRTLVQLGGSVKAGTELYEAVAAALQLHDENREFDLWAQDRPSGHNAATAIRQQILDDAITWTSKTLESGMAINRVDVFTIVIREVQTCLHLSPVWTLIWSTPACGRRCTPV